VIYLNSVTDLSGDLDQPISDSPQEHSLESRRIRDSIPDDLINQLMAQVKDGKLSLLGDNGVIAQLTKGLLERALEEERTIHLGYERGDPMGNGSGNSRNGTTPKTVLTDLGAVDLDIPRDRNGSFEPIIVPKGDTRLAKFNENIIALYTQGMTTRDIKKMLKQLYSVEVSADFISRVTDGVVEELAGWQARPLDAIYPIIYIDALFIKVRTQAVVAKRPVYIAIGVDVEGFKHVLGLWLGDGGEGAKFWLCVLTEVKNRGVEDVIFVCCDGLKGLPDAIEATWPNSVIQTCVVHLIRASLRYCTHKDRRSVVAGLKPIYCASSLEEAQNALERFESQFGSRYPGIVSLWKASWENFTPFLAYPSLLRKIIYTTNMIESVNYQLRKASKTRGHFPDDDSALKLLRLIAKNLSTTRGGTAGTKTPQWKEVLNTLAIHFPGRLDPVLN